MNICPITLFIAAFIADRATKWWAFTTLSDVPVPVCYGFDFVIAWNKGVSWSMFWAASPVAYWLLTACITAMIVGLFVYVYRRAVQGYSISFEILVLAGAVSNLLDRLYYGAVLDFIQLYVGSYYWPVFNIADVFICVGAAGLFMQSFKGCNEAKN